MQMTLLEGRVRAASAALTIGLVMGACTLGGEATSSEPQSAESAAPIMYLESVQQGIQAMHQGSDSCRPLEGTDTSARTLAAVLSATPEEVVDWRYYPRAGEPRQIELVIQKKDEPGPLVIHVHLDNRKCSEFDLGWPIP
jgi:hypothetical protein